MERVFTDYLKGIRYVQPLRKEKTLIFTNGCFDLIHYGHISYLKEAKGLGDILVVGLNSDSSVKRLKGSKRPILDEKTRAVILSSFRFVDYVFLFKEDTPVNLITKLKPDIYVKGGDYKIEDLPEYNVVSKYGGKVLLLDYIENYSTTGIIDKIIDRYCKGG